VEESIEEALASMRLEGLEPSQDLLDDLELVRGGIIDADGLVARTLDRYPPKDSEPLEKRRRRSSGDT